MKRSLSQVDGVNLSEKRAKLDSVVDAEDTEDSPDRDETRNQAPRDSSNPAHAHHDHETIGDPQNIYDRENEILFEELLENNDDHDHDQDQVLVSDVTINVDENTLNAKKKRGRKPNVISAQKSVVAKPEKKPAEKAPLNRDLDASIVIHQDTDSTEKNYRKCKKIFESFDERDKCQIEYVLTIPYEEHIAVLRGFLNCIKKNEKVSLLILNVQREGGVYPTKFYRTQHIETNIFIEISHISESFYSMNLNTQKQRDIVICVDAITISKFFETIPKNSYFEIYGLRDHLVFYPESDDNFKKILWLKTFNNLPEIIDPVQLDVLPLEKFFDPQLEEDQDQFALRMVFNGIELQEFTQSTGKVRMRLVRDREHKDTYRISFIDNSENSIHNYTISASDRKNIDYYAALYEKTSESIEHFYDIIGSVHYLDFMYKNKQPKTHTSTISLSLCPETDLTTEHTIFDEMFSFSTITPFLKHLNLANSITFVNPIIIKNKKHVLLMFVIIDVSAKNTFSMSYVTNIVDD